MPEIVNSDSSVNVSNRAPRGRSKMPDMKYRFANTLRFGEYSPHFVMECVNNDDIPYRSVHNLRSYTLKSPILNDIRIHKDYFFVPNMAILPLNWDKIEVNPTIGDDVNASLVNSVIPFSLDSTKSFNDIYKNACNILSNFFNGDQKLGIVPDPSNGLKYLILYILFFERFCSTGSLLNTLGFKGNSLLRNKDNEAYWKFTIEGVDSVFAPDIYDFDKEFDSFFTSLFNNLKDSVTRHAISVTFGNEGPIYLDDLDLSGYRSVIDRMRDTSDFSIYIDDSSPCSFEFVEQKSFFNFSLKKDINLSRVLAYQIVCSHFYTNDKVDYVYSAELYRQNVGDCYLRAGSFYGDWPTFTYNGISTAYDYLSGIIFQNMFNILAFASYDETDMLDAGFDFWRLILGYNRSLRYVDYFTGSRTRPLAVGDVNINVVDNKVSAVDTTINLQRLKFLNFLNHTKRTFEDYVAKLGGRYVSPDYHNPFALVQTADNVVTTEVENTGVDQLTQENSVTSNYRSNSSKYCFTFPSDRNSILIGITYFDIPRFYDCVTDRQFFHVNRYDMFNPFMQFTGDQVIYGQEYDLLQSSNFGYQSRNIEYKNRVDSCSGGFANDSLPSWIYKNREAEFVNQGDKGITPNFIRSHSSELDKFFTSLTGISLGTYFHFICIFDNITEPSRPMVYQPQIL